MTSTIETLQQAARALPAGEMGDLVSRLLDDLSDGIQDQADDELDAEAEKREKEMDADPSLIMSHDQMLAFIRSRRS